LNVRKPEHLAVGFEAFAQGFAQAAGCAGQQQFVVGLDRHIKITWLGQAWRHLHRALV